MPEETSSAKDEWNRKPIGPDWIQLIHKYHKSCLVCLVNPLPWLVPERVRMCDDCLEKFIRAYRRHRYFGDPPPAPHKIANGL